MTRKDYRLIASTINRVYQRADFGQREIVREIVRSLAVELKEDNIQFKIDKFVDVCLEEQVQ